MRGVLPTSAANSSMVSTGQPVIFEAHSGPLRRALHRGMVTAEYAVGILAAVAFALVLYSVVTDDQTKNALLRVVIDWMGQLSAFLPK